MKTLKIAVAQFQPKDGDKDYNLSVSDKLTAKAKEGGAEVISFHEMSITAYTFLKDLTRDEVKSYAEKVPGKSTEKLIAIAAKHDITVFAGLVEADDADKLYNTS